MRQGIATVSARVNEGSPIGNVEYMASVNTREPLTVTGFEGLLWADLTNVQKRQVMIAAVKAVRDAQQNDDVDLGITGNVTI